MKTLLTVLVASAAAVALAGCSKPAPKAANQSIAAKDVRVDYGPVDPSGRKYVSGQIVPIPATCPTDIGDPAKDLHYEIVLGKKFELRYADNVKNAPNPKEPQDHGPDKTRLDMGTEVDYKQPATIHIRLDTNSQLKFMAGNLAVPGGGPNADKIFCNVVRVSDYEVTFRTYQQVGGPTFAAYNLGLIVTDRVNKDFELPVIVDPVVDNEGIDGGPPPLKK